MGHHLGIDTQASGGVDDDDVIELALGLDDGVTSHLDGIANTVAGLRSEDMHTGSLTDDLQLGDRVGTLQVTGGQQRRVPLLLEPPSELARQGRLTGTLKSSEHDDGGRGLREPDGAGLTAKDLDELLVDDLDDLLSRVERLRQFLAVTAFLDRRNEFLDDRQVDVGLEEGDADLASRGVDVGIGETSLATQSLEGGCPGECRTRLSFSALVPYRDSLPSRSDMMIQSEVTDQTGPAIPDTAGRKACTRCCDAHLRAAR